MATFIRSLAVVFCLAVVLFFALKPGPEVPHALASDQIRIFLNSHDALRNQLAFGLFAIAVLFALMTKRRLNRRQLVAISLIALLIPALELAQIWMPERHVDIDDVLNGWLGLGIACLLYVIVWRLWRIATPSRSKN
ncbi:MAG: VanZ family protein [Terrimicrobiaceae bacterium]